MSFSSYAQLWPSDIDTMLGSTGYVFALFVQHLHQMTNFFMLNLIKTFLAGHVVIETKMYQLDIHVHDMHTAICEFFITTFFRDIVLIK